MWIVVVARSNGNSVDAMSRVWSSDWGHAREKVLLQVCLVGLEHLHGKRAESHVPEESTDGALMGLKIGNKGCVFLELGRLQILRPMETLVDVAGATSVSSVSQMAWIIQLE